MVVYVNSNSDPGDARRELKDLCGREYAMKVVVPTQPLLVNLGDATRLVLLSLLTELQLNAFKAAMRQQTGQRVVSISATCQRSSGSHTLCVEIRNSADETDREQLC